MKLSISLPIGFVLGRKSLVEKLLPMHSKSAYKTNRQELISLSHSHIKGVELVINTRTTEEDITQATEKLKAYKLRVLTIHQPLTYVYYISFKNIEKLCMYANLSGAKVVVIHITALSNKLISNTSINKLHFLEKKYQVYFAVENIEKSIFFFKHDWWNPNLFGEKINNVNLGITLDISHLGKSGGDIIKFFLENKKKIYNIQLSDYDKRTHKLLGEGKLPIERFLKTLNSENYNGIITFEINDSIEKIIRNALIIF